MPSSVAPAAVHHPFYRQTISLESHNSFWRFWDIKYSIEGTLHESKFPRKYKITDYIGGIPRFQSVTTQRDRAGAHLDSPFSLVTIHHYGLFHIMTSHTLIELPDIRQMVFLPQPRNYDIFAVQIMALNDLLRRFSSLRSVAIPVELVQHPLILKGLEDHPRLVHLELLSVHENATHIESLKLRLPLDLPVGIIGDVQNRLQKVTIPMSVLSPGLLHFFGDMKKLLHLKVTVTGGGSCGDRFADLISEHDIRSSPHAFQMLRVLDVGVRPMLLSNFRILTQHFPGVEYV